ncbi:MAG: cyclic nucleotide-binding domain-containing protein [Chloroflexota bacterium]
MGIFAALTSFVFLQIKHQIQPNRAPQVTIAFLTTLVLVYYLLVQIDIFTWLTLVGFVVWGACHFPIQITGATLLKRTLTTDQFREHGDLISAAEMGGSVLAGLAVAVFVSSFSVRMLLILPLLSLVALFILVSGYERVLTADASPNTQVTQPTRYPLGGMFQDRYIATLIGFYMLLSIAVWAVDFSLFDHTRDMFTSEASIANFLGIVYAVIFFISMLLRLFGSGQMLNRYGVRFGLLANPILLLLGFIAIAVCILLPLPSSLFLALIVLIKVGESLLSIAFEGSTRSFLLVSQSEFERLEINHRIQSIVLPLGATIIGGILLLFQVAMPQSPLAYALVILPLMAILIGLSFNVYSLYRENLKRVVDQRQIDGETRLEANADSFALLVEKLDHPRASAVIYVLDQIEDLHPDRIEEIIENNLSHPAPEVRQNLLERVARLRLRQLWVQIKRRVEIEKDPFIQGMAQRVVASLADETQVEQLSAQLESDNLLLQRETMVGLLLNGDVEGVVVAGAKLRELIESEDPFERQLAADALGESGLERLANHLATLLEDEDPNVKLAAVVAAGKLNVPSLWPQVAATLGDKGIGYLAVMSLINGGDSALPALKPLFKSDNRLILTRMCIIHGRIGTPAAAEQLERVLIQPDPVIQYELLKALAKSGHGIKHESPRKIYDLLLDDIDEIEKLEALYNALDGHPDTYTVNQALREDIERVRHKLFLWLSLVQPPDIISEIENGLRPDQPEEKQMTAIGLIEEKLSTRVASRILPIFFPSLDDTPVLPIDIPVTDILIQMIQGTYKAISTWSQACALYTLASIGPTIDDSVEIVIHQAHYSSNPLLSETAGWLIYHLNLTPTAKFRLESLYKEENIMLSTVEKMIALKATPYFVDTPEIALYSIADELFEVLLQEGESLFYADEPGDCMFIIVDGHIDIHDNELLITSFTSGDVFGELAVIDPAPRSATATAKIETLLLRLDSDPFRELINDHGYIAHRIMRELAGRLRHTQHLKTRADE